MSESKHYSDRVESFLRAHPQENGWHVYNIDQYPVLCEFDALPEFVRATFKESIVTMKAIERLVMDCTTNKEDVTLLRNRLEHQGWYGKIDLEWQGSAIHMERNIAMTSRGSHIEQLLAAKSPEGIQSFWQALRRFNLENIRTDRIRLQFNRRIPVQKVIWGDVILPNSLRTEIQSATEAFFCSKEKYAEFGLAYRRGFLFTGSPGCGKTMTIKAIISNHSVPTSAYYPDGETRLDGLRYIFEEAAANAPSILVLEDMDKFTVDLAAVLNMLDGLETPLGVLVIATANNPENLDAALLLRPSRFDRVWSFPLPAFDQRLELLRRKGCKRFGDQALEEVAKGSQGFSMAYVQEILATAVTCAMNERKDPGDEHLLRSLSILKNQIRTSQKAPGEIGKQSDGVGFAAECQNA